MSLAEYVYTVVLRPRPLKKLANTIIRRMIPQQVTVGGAVIVLNPQDPVVSGALTFGVYEKPETKLFSAAFLPGMTFLDVGANIGYYTALAMVRRSARVIALEPDPENFRFLQKTVAANRSGNGEQSDVVCLQKAAGPEAGVATLHTSTSNRGDNRLYANDLSDSTVQVEVASVDTILEQMGVPSVDFIKIDVQGFEGHVMAGLGRTIRNSPRLTLLMEFWPFGLKSAGTNPEDLLTSLENMGLRLFELTEKATLLPLKDKADLIGRFQGRRYTNIVGLQASAAFPEGCRP